MKQGLNDLVCKLCFGHGIPWTHFLFSGLWIGWLYLGGPEPLLVTLISLNAISIVIYVIYRKEILIKKNANSIKRGK